MSFDIQVLEKQPTESRRYDMDFGANLSSTETISSVTSIAATPTGLVLGSSAISGDGQKIQFRISGGADGIRYKVTGVVITSESNTLEFDGYLQVTEL